jgi:hypothetical protein
MRGRPRGVWQYPEDDVLCVEMARLVNAGMADWDAARRVVGRCRGPITTPRSKLRRLVRHYRARKEDWHAIAARPPRSDSGFRDFTQAIRAMERSHRQMRAMERSYRQLLAAALPRINVTTRRN